MNRNFIFFILLVILSVTPLQLHGETQFKKCEEYPDAELLAAKLTPDPIEPGEQTFEVFITLQNYNITQGTALYINVVDQVNPKELAFYSVDLCSLSDCPINAGTKAASPFSSTQKFTLPKIPSKYFIRLEHFLVEPDVTDPYACGIAVVGN